MACCRAQAPRAGTGVKAFSRKAFGFPREARRPQHRDARRASERIDKPLDLDWPERLKLKARFVTKGVALGSQAFVEEALEEFSEQLGYRRSPTKRRKLAYGTRFIA
jgi:hypothetical protein